MNDDGRLRTLFADLRSRDGRDAPTLEALLARAQPAPVRLHLAPPALVAGLVGAAVLVFLFRPARPDPGPIARWRSPTASLLQSPETDLLAGTPHVGESWLSLPTEVKK